MNINFPQELIEEIRASNDIVEVVSEYVQLKKKGRNYFGNCPFHNEKTPSMSVSADKQIFHCFGCSEGGNVISFVMKIENMDFGETLKYLADRAHIELPEQNFSDDYKKKLALKEQIFNVNKEAARFFHNNLVGKFGLTATEYLSKRGIDANVIKRFGLGCSLNDWDSLNKHLLGLGYLQDIILKAGLSRKTEKNSYFDYFRNRIMFPILDTYSNVIGFGGRTMGDDGPKYLNTSETAVFNKGNNLYALNIVKKSKSNNIIIAEGYMDVIAIHQFGVDSAVATLGTALTENQARLLRKYTDEVIVAFDSDSAGVNATLRSIEILKDVGLDVKVLQIPDGKDPDEFLRKNDINKFIYLINHSKTYLEYKINDMKKGYNLKKVDDKIKFLSNISKTLAKIDNTIERDAYIKVLSKESDISEESIVAHINKILNNSSIKNIKLYNTKTVNNKISIENSKLDYAEKLLIFLISQENVYEKIKDSINLELFSIDENIPVARAVINKLENNLEVNPSELMINLSDQEVKIVSKIFTRNESYEDLDKAVSECMEFINNYNKQVAFNKILNTKDISHDDIDRIKKLDELIKLKKTR